MLLRAFFLSVGLFFASSVTDYAQESSDEEPAFQFNKKAYYLRSTEGGILEYLTANDTFEKWRTLFSIREFTGTDNPKLYAQKLLENAKASGPDVRGVLMENKEAGSYIVDFLVFSAEGEEPAYAEWNLWRVEKKGDGVEAVQYARRFYDFNEESGKKIAAAREGLVQELAGFEVPKSTGAADAPESESPPAQLHPALDIVQKDGDGTVYLLKNTETGKVLGTFWDRENDSSDYGFESSIVPDFQWSKDRDYVAVTAGASRSRAVSLYRVTGDSLKPIEVPQLSTEQAAEIDAIKDPSADGTEAVRWQSDGTLLLHFWATGTVTSDDEKQPEANVWVDLEVTGDTAKIVGTSTEEPSAPSDALAEPKEIAKGSKLRAALFDLARHTVEHEAGQPVKFAGSVTRLGDWAFFNGQIVNAAGKQIRIGQGESADTAILWKIVDSEWQLITCAVGITDVAYASWPETFGAPTALVLHEGSGKP